MWDCGGFDLLGITTWKGPARDVHLRLEPGVTVLCGRNGSGKTTILRALEGALRGYPNFAGELHLRLPTPPRRPELDLARTVLGLSSPQPGERITMQVDHHQRVHPSGRDRLWEGESVADFLASELVHGSNAPELALEIARLGFVGATAAGTEGDPHWMVSVGAHLSEGGPGLRHELEALARRAREGTWVEMSEESPGAIVASLCELFPPDESTWDHPWVPARIGYVSETSALTVPTVVSESHPLDIDRESFALAAEGDGELFGDGPDAGPSLAPRVLERLEQITTTANKHYQALLTGAPELRCSPSGAERWLAGAPPVRWEALDRPSRSWLPLEALSRAEERWASVAIRATLASRPVSESGGVVILDEPEAALHPLAVRQMVEGLKYLVSSLGIHVVVATHSRELLEDPDLHLTLVSRGVDGRTEVNEMDAPTRAHLEQLGCSVADLLQMTRVILLVEGEHDRIVLDTLVGDDLRRERVLIVPIRGGAQLRAVAEADLLFDLTEAPFVVVLDHVRHEAFSSRWREAIEAARDDRSAAAEALRDRNNWSSEEERWLADLCSKALLHGQDDRVVPFGLVKQDILDYLDPDAVAPGSGSWEALRNAGPKGSGKRFKAWLTSEHHADLSEKGVAEAARQLDRVPEEFVKLADACRLAGRQRGR